MNLIKKPLSRRTLLRGVGGACIALPYLDVMAPHRATAQQAAPQRLITMFTPNGQMEGHFVCEGVGRDFELSDVLKPLESQKKRLIAFDDNINNDAANDKVFGGHQGSFCAMLSGWGPVNTKDFDTMRPAAPSVDQIVADKIAGDTPFRTLQVGVVSRFFKDNFRVVPSWRSEKELFAPQQEPAQLFDSLFKDALQQPDNTESVERARLTRRSLLDGVASRYERLNARLGLEDRARLDLHLSSIRELEKRVVTDRQISCAPPDRAQGNFDRGGGNLDNYADVQIDLTATAIACGLTNVASFMFLGMGSNNTQLSFLGHKDHNHSHAHGRNGPALLEANQFYASQLNRLMTKLETYQDAGGSSLLDRTLILWWNELGNGNHSTDKAPYLLAGGAGDELEMGRMVRFSAKQQSNDVLLTVHNAVTKTEETVFGDPKYSSGPLPGV